MIHHEYSVYIGGKKVKHKKIYCEDCQMFFSHNTHLYFMRLPKKTTINVRSHKKQTGIPRPCARDRRSVKHNYVNKHELS